MSFCFDVRTSQSPDFYERHWNGVIICTVMTLQSRAGPKFMIQIRRNLYPYHGLENCAFGYRVPQKGRQYLRKGREKQRKQKGNNTTSHKSAIELSSYMIAGVDESNRCIFRQVHVRLRVA